MIAARALGCSRVILLGLLSLGCHQSSGSAVAKPVLRSEIVFQGFWMSGNIRLAVDQTGQVNWEKHETFQPTRSGSCQLSEQDHTQILKLFRNWKSKRSDRQWFPDLPVYSITFDGKSVETQAYEDENPELRPVTRALFQLLDQVSA